MLNLRICTFTALALLLAGCGDSDGERTVLDDGAALTETAGPEPTGDPESGHSTMSDDVRQTIEQRLEALGEAAAGGWSAEMAAAFFSRDAKLLPPGGPVVTGPAGVAEFWTEFAAKSGLARIETTTHEAVKTGEGYVVERGAYVMYRADGAKMGSGKYMTLWVEEDGEWKLHWDAWNVDSLVRWQERRRELGSRKFIS